MQPTIVDQMWKRKNILTRAEEWRNARAFATEKWSGELWRNYDGKNIIDCHGKSEQIISRIKEVDTIRRKNGTMT